MAKDTKEKILAKALELFSQKGYEGTNINELMEYQEGGIKIEMPAAELNTYQLVEVSRMPKEAMLWSHSCHTSNTPCMKCSGCLKNYAVRYKYGLG